MLSIILTTEVIKIMKTYQSGAKEKKTKRSFFARYMYPIIFGTALLLVAAAITLTLVLTQTKAPASVTPNPDPPITDVDTPPVTFCLPVTDYTLGKGAVLNSLAYSSTLKQWRTHNGVDFQVAAGAAVLVITDGTVKSVTSTNLEGTVVTVEHANGLTSIYKGLAAEGVVAEGTTVKAGDTIGKVAETMMLEQLDGTHLHLEMRKNGTLVDPMTYLVTDSDK